MYSQNDLTHKCDIWYAHKISIYININPHTSILFDVNCWPPHIVPFYDSISVSISISFCVLMWVVSQVQGTEQRQIRSKQRNSENQICTSQTQIKAQIEMCMHGSMSAVAKRNNSSNSHTVVKKHLMPVEYESFAELRNNVRSTELSTKGSLHMYNVYCI